MASITALYPLWLRLLEEFGRDRNADEAKPPSELNREPVTEQDHSLDQVLPCEECVEFYWDCRRCGRRICTHNLICLYRKGGRIDLCRECYNKSQNGNSTSVS